MTLRLATKAQSIKVRIRGISRYVLLSGNKIPLPHSPLVVQKIKTTLLIVFVAERYVAKADQSASLIDNANLTIQA
jgi:hypothetical protein